MSLVAIRFSLDLSLRFLFWVLDFIYIHQARILCRFTYIEYIMVSVLSLACLSIFSFVLCLISLTSLEM
jgi:hypothetical protein